MGKNSGDMETAWASHIHEKAIRRLNKSLELVLALFVALRREEKVLWHSKDKIEVQSECCYVTTRVPNNIQRTLTIGQNWSTQWPGGESRPGVSHFVATQFAHLLYIVVP